MYKIERSRGRSEFSLEQIEKIQDDINFEDELGSVEQRKLKFIYSRAVNEAKNEEEFLRDALEKINEIRTIINERRLQVHTMFYDCKIF